MHFRESCVYGKKECSLANALLGRFVILLEKSWDRSEWTLHPRKNFSCVGISWCMCLNDVMFYTYSYSEWPCRNSPHFSHLYMVIEKGHGQTWDLEIIHLLQDRQVKLVACVAGYTGSWEQSIKPDNFKHLFSLMLLGKRGSKSANFWGYLCFHRPLFYNDLKLTPTFHFFKKHMVDIFYRF